VVQFKVISNGENYAVSELHQNVSAAGVGNTVIQIVGDGNSVVSGHPYLTLTRYVGRRQIHQDLDRLSPYARSTTLLGREDELASLCTFLNDLRPLLARVLIGGGGSGKTRLALELCETFAGKDWDTGFVTRSELRRFFTQQNLSGWGWHKPTFIVVDYAAEHAQLLGQWFDELADRTAPTPHPLRVLLLERSASTETGWWTVVFASGGWGASSKRAVLDPPDPVTIRPLVHVEDRLTLLRTMLEQASPGKPITVPFDDATFRDKLMQLTWGGDPLFLMMAALSMLEVGHAKTLTLDRTDLADKLAEREAGRLGRLAEAASLKDKTLVQHLAACVTLVQGMNREDFEAFSTTEIQAINRAGGGDAAAIADVLQEALPRPNGIAPVLPDLIGEALIVRTMKQGAGAAAVLRCHASMGHTVAETVIRCAQDFTQSSAPLQWLDGIARAGWDDAQALAMLDASLPMESVVLRDINLLVAQRLLDLRRAEVGTLPNERAAALNGLAIALAQAGEREAALQTAQEAVDIRRELAAQRPDVFRPDLAASLNTLATRLSDLGEREAALQAAQEAVDIRRELAAQRPDVFRPDLAGSLNTLATRLSDLGEREAALQAAQEAADLYRELAVQRSDVFRPDLAMSLSNLANRLSELGEREAACQPNLEMSSSSQSRNVRF
jgi:tetratricopeptide (TPR) repeat protein